MRRPALPCAPPLAKAPFCDRVKIGGLFRPGLRSSCSCSLFIWCVFVYTRPASTWCCLCLPVIATVRRVLECVISQSRPSLFLPHSLPSMYPHTKFTPLCATTRVFVLFFFFFLCFCSFNSIFDNPLTPSFIPRASFEAFVVLRVCSFLLLVLLFPSPPPPLHPFSLAFSFVLFFISPHPGEALYCRKLELGGTLVQRAN